MRLTRLEIQHTQVTDLTPLRGMPLAALNIGGTRISDLSPLRGLPLTTLEFGVSDVSDLTPLSGCKKLQYLKFGKCKVTTEGVTALQNRCRSARSNGRANCPGLRRRQMQCLPPPVSATLDNLPFEQWMKAVAALPVPKQADAVGRKLQQLNPGFDGKVTPTIDNGVVAGWSSITISMADLSPVRALKGLNALSCRASGPAKGKLSDLSPLAGMPLVTLRVSKSQVADLSPLKGMPLKELVCGLSKVSDLSPLKSMRLTILDCFRATSVSDLSPLQGMPLEHLGIAFTKVSDLTPLKECKNLQSLKLNGSRVTPAGVAALQKALPKCKIEWDAAK